MDTPKIGFTCGKFLRPERKPDGKGLITCGCVLKLKTPMKNQKCPQGKW